LKTRMCLILFVASFVIFASLHVPVMADAETRTIFYVENGVGTTYATSAVTVQEFLKEREISLTPRDTLSMGYKDILETGSRIELKRGFYVNVSIEGAVQRFKVSQNTTMGTFIRLFEQETNKPYHFSGSLVKILTPDETVFLTEYREATVVEEYEIPFETQRQETEELLKGTEILDQEGQPGKKINTYKVIYLGKEEHSRELISEVIETEPLPEITLIGVALPTPTPTPKPPVAVASTGNLGARASSTSEFSYSQVYTMTSTAYTAGPESTGKSPGSPGYGITASGMRVQPGVVSVDPRVIPLGTRLYVEGYGYSIAADTGGAIQGNKIDVYFEKLSDALNWGRRTVQVYVLN